MKRKILIVEDNVALSGIQKEWLERTGYEVRTAVDEPSARKLLRKEPFDLVLSDVRLPEGSGISLLEWMGKEHTGIPFVVMTGYASISDAVHAVKLGARDYLPKPVHKEHLLELVRELVRPVSVVRCEKQLFKRVSGKAREVECLVTLAAPSDVSVLILGANGTGKESVAQGIHQHSDRSSQPFIAVNCGGIPKELAASDFFGHVRGAFTGADRDKKGYFALAEGGTLFLDEIGNMPLELQALLLRVLQEHAYIPVGGHKEIHADVRIVSATNTNLWQAVHEGLFREDLYHRLAEFKICQPPLAECTEDILPFANFFLQRFSEEYRKTGLYFSGQARAMLVRYPWPGNVRELRNCIRKAVIMVQGKEISAGDLDFEDGWNGSVTSPCDRRADKLRHKEDLRHKEREEISSVLEECGGNVSRAAQILGISRPTLYARIKKYGLG